jgi:hypothetical protein
MDKCVSAAVRHPMVRETINQYINHLNQLINNNIMDNNPELREFVANHIDKIKEVVEIYKVHQGRPGRIHWFLNDKLKDIKLSGSHDANRDEGTPYSQFYLCENNTSDYFEVDFDENGIGVYYHAKDQQLAKVLKEKGLDSAEYYYIQSDEEIAEKIAKQIRAIINLINEK